MPLIGLLPPAHSRAIPFLEKECLPNSIELSSSTAEKLNEKKTWLVLFLRKGYFLYPEASLRVQKQLFSLGRSMVFWQGALGESQTRALVILGAVATARAKSWLQRRQRTISPAAQ